MVVKATRGECVVLEVTPGRPGGGSLARVVGPSGCGAGGMLTVTVVQFVWLEGPYLKGLCVKMRVSLASEGNCK